MKSSARRLWWLLRIAGHDWMWEGGARPDRLRRVARRLPLYFSDPYWMPAEEFDRILREGEPVEFSTTPRLRLTSTWPVSTSAQTWATTSKTTTWTFPDDWPSA